MKHLAPVEFYTRKPARCVFSLNQKRIEMNQVKVCCIAFCLVLLSIFVLAHDTVTTNSQDPDCGKGPCGWAVYNRITRNIEFFMGNKCSCKPELNCTRDDDDISITAYVYRCRNSSKIATNS